MRLAYSFVPFSLVIIAVASLASPAFADEPVTLMGTIVKWRYPGAEMAQTEMSDGATTDADGKRTVSSSVLKTTMTTPDPVDSVLKFYRELLTRNQANDSRLGIEATTGRSVLFSDDSNGQPFALHTVVINSRNASTTIIVTRGAGEDRTRIVWKQYLTLETGG